AREDRGRATGSWSWTARRGRTLQIPDDSDPGEQADDCVVEIELPPAEPHAGRGRTVMRVVVPALAQQQQGQRDVVPAIVASPERPGAVAVSDGAETQHPVIDDDGA